VKLRFHYSQKVRGWFILGWGFDPGELTQVKFHLSVCPQHKEFEFSIQLLGLMLDLYISEPV